MLSTPREHRLVDSLRQWAHEAGFELYGIAAAEPAPQSELLKDWLDHNMHGSMQYLEDPQGKRRDPRVYLPWARSLIVVGLSYYTEHPLTNDADRGAISRYAWGGDYHREVRRRLETLRTRLLNAQPNCKTHPFVDTAPILEKGHAQAAGLGWRGKHTNLLRKGFGSWFFLGGLATDLPLPTDNSASNHCGTCQRCIDVCPTQAIVAPYVLDAKRCISYLTIELRGPIPRALRPLIGNRIYGCDDCQDVCPWNHFAQPTGMEEFQPRPGNLNPTLLPLLAMSKQEWNRRFKKTAIRRAHYEGFLRNVAVAIGNWGAPEALPALQQAMQHESALVRGHVAWALGRLATQEAFAILRTARQREHQGANNPWVCEEIADALG